MRKNTFVAGALPQIPLGELIALPAPRPSSQIDVGPFRSPG